MPFLFTEDAELHVLVDGINRPPELLKPGEKWTRLSHRDVESAKNQRKLSQFFGAKAFHSKLILELFFFFLYLII